MHRRRESLCGIQMGMLLIVEENVRAQSFQDASFVHAAKEMGFVDRDIPGAQGVDDALMGGRAAGCHDGGLQETAIIAVLFLPFVLQRTEVAKLLEQIAKWSRGNGGLGLLGFR